MSEKTYFEKICLTSEINIFRSVVAQTDFKKFEVCYFQNFENEVKVRNLFDLYLWSCTKSSSEKNTF